MPESDRLESSPRFDQGHRLAEGLGRLRTAKEALSVEFESVRSTFRSAEGRSLRLSGEAEQFAVSTEHGGMMMHRYGTGGFGEPGIDYAPSHVSEQDVVVIKAYEEGVCVDTGHDTYPILTYDSIYVHSDRAAGVAG